MKDLLGIGALLAIYAALGLMAVMAFVIMQTKEHEHLKWPRAIFWTCLIALVLLSL